MKFNKFAVTAAMTAVVVGTSAGVVHAEPAPTPDAPSAAAPERGIQTDILPGIHYTSSIVDNSVVFKTDSGSLTVQGNQFQVLDGQGKLVAGLPLTYRKDSKEWPIAAKINGNTAVLTPSVDPAAARPATPIDQPKPVASQAQWDAALGMASAEFGLAIGVATLVGTVIGAVLGCVAGALTVGTITFPVFLAGAAGGCLAGAGTGAFLGVVAGTILVGVPVGIAVAIDFFNRINAPDPYAAPAQ